MDDFNSGNPKLNPGTKRLADLLSDHVEVRVRVRVSVKVRVRVRVSGEVRVRVRVRGPKGWPTY